MVKIDNIAKRQFKVHRDDGTEKFYEFVSEFNDYGVAKVMIADKWGIINRDGVEVIPPQYEYIGDFYQGFAKMEKGAFYGYVNSKGETVIPLVFKR